MEDPQFHRWPLLMRVVGIAEAHALASYIAIFFTLMVIAKSHEEPFDIGGYGLGLMIAPLITIGGFPEAVYPGYEERPMCRVALLLYAMTFIWVNVNRWRSWKYQAIIAGDRCMHCLYDLTGNVSGVCPECGTEVAVHAKVTT
jgi:hypothetical protein